MQQRTLCLTGEERAYLEKTRDRERRAYLRERAAALLKIADGMAPFAVAKTGLLKPRHPETIYLWLNDFEKTRQLTPQPARRKRLSPPRGGSKASAGTGSPKSSKLWHRPESLDARASAETVSLPGAPAHERRHLSPPGQVGRRLQARSPAPVQSRPRLRRQSLCRARLPVFSPAASHRGHRGVRR